eukprot:maker-scaffold_26-snap-gene-2.59-mRNA-1 protein AED:0.05 eAED:0.05 QI:114/1/1/1/1/1/3/96/289
MESIKEMIESGDHYTALQSVKAKISRSKKSKPANRPKTLDLAFAASKLLLDAQQPNSSQEIISDTLEFLLSTKTMPSEPLLKSLSTSLSYFLISHPNNPQVAKLTLKLTEKANEWLETTNKSSTRKHPMLQKVSGDCYAELGKTGKAVEAYAESIETKEDLDKFLEFILVKIKVPSEVAVHMASSVLLLLARANLKDANYLFKTFQEKKLPKNKAMEPLNNFLEFLLLTLERDAKPLFLTLREKYQKILRIDPNLNKTLDKIGKRFYNIEIQQQQSNDMMQNMMRMFSG